MQTAVPSVARVRRHACAYRHPIRLEPRFNGARSLLHGQGVIHRPLGRRVVIHFRLFVGRDLHLMYSLIGDRRTLAREAKSMRQQPFVVFVYFVVQ